jgi:hypothetical protein
MDHEAFLDELDGLDAGEKLSAEAEGHAGRCADCGRAREAGAFVARAIRASVLSPPEDFRERVMDAVRKSARPAAMLSLVDWILVLAVIFGAVALAPFGDGFAWARAIFGSAYVLPLMLTLGVALAAFGMVLVGTHMDELLRLAKAGHRR